MLKMKTIAALICSLLMGFLAVLGVGALKKKPVPVKAAVSVPAEPAVVEKAHRKKEARTITFSDRIPNGMRITTIRVNEVSGVSRAVQRGDRVDVVAVTKLGDTSGGMISRMVLQNIAVFDYDPSSPEKHITDTVSKRKKEWAVHLLVTPDQGTLLSSVSSGAELRLLLRNRDDDTIIDACPAVYTSGTGSVTVDDTSSDPSSRLKPGMRAVTLKIDDSDGICGSFAPGDRVDIIFSCKASRFTTQGGNQAVGTQGAIVDVRKSARILIQDVEVLTTQNVLKTLLETNTPEQYVTLSMTASQAEQVALITESSKSGTIKLIARNREDKERVHTAGEILEDILLKDKRSYRVIQVLKGGETIPVKFYVN